jgi:N-acetylneuraminic acid mutarotase
MAKDKKKSKEGKDAKKARVAQKQEKKATQKDKKTKARGPAADDSDAEDGDIDAILAEYQKQQEQFNKVTEQVSDPPSARASATIVANPASNNEIFLFGGEYYNGAMAKFFNELYVYKTNSDSWRKVTSPNSPLPRSGHAWCQGGNDKAIYLFGGEFSSPKQGTFYHYNDFWRLEPSTREWTKLDQKGGPPARSGHRMTAFKNYIIIFGGFQDTSQQTKYLQDIWLYDTQSFKWITPTLPPASGKPDARSSFSILPHDSGAVIYGGYSRVKANAATKSKGGKAQAGGGGSRVVMKPMLHQDTWFLRITPPASDSAPNTLPTVRWERRKRPANAPNPPRAGATMAHHKGRGVWFGGVHDVEESEEGIDSEFFNQLFAYNIDRNRFFPLTLRRARTGAKKPNSGDKGGRRGRGKADEEELLRNLAMIEGKGNADEAADADTAAAAANESDSDKEDSTKVEKPILWEFPHPRFNAQLAVQDDTCFIYGGTYEKGDREFTFDELWSLDLGKMDGVKEIFKREIGDWQDDESEDDEDEDDEDEDDEDDEENSGDEDGASNSTPATSVAPSEAATAEIEETEADEKTTSAQSDGLPYPRPFESLRDFFVRSGVEWQEIILTEMKFRRLDDIAERSVKEVRKTAFTRAEARWWDVREEVQTLEDEQEAAGIQEVVSLAERGGGGGEGGGAPRRR